ncbi:MFS transporter [Alkalicoccobacillus porphyridii]|uniref:MFS transporter n=1 Tax=Alkalicoccobacillus porphyridii TaxID=2597270 RepID=A0A554A378_9BACI|nr:MFS transporter [Alkalicoccobacillus porphyridii]TSB48138.1 MFS transporter [Alkalicoccobacillus porphyridii]
MKQKNIWGIGSIASIPLVMTLGNSMLIPVLPTIEKKLGISSLQVSLLITVYSIVAILCIPIAGYLSDHIGRKQVIIPSLILAAAGGTLAGVAAWRFDSPYFWILAGRLLQGIGAAGAAPIAFPLVGDLFTTEKEVSAGLGLVETSNTFGKVISPILGAILASIIWYLPFFSFPIFCFISILLLIFFVHIQPSQKKPQKFKAFIKSIKEIFKREGRWLFIVFFIGGLCMYLIFGLLFYLSTHLEKQYGIQDIKKGVVLAFPLAALCLSSYLSGKLIGQDKMKMKWYTVFGLALLTISIMWISLSEDIYVLLTALFLAGLGIGAALPSLDAFVTEGIRQEQRGSITSLYSSMRFVGVALGPPVFAALAQFNHFVIFFSHALFCLISLLLTIVMIKPEKPIKSNWS